MKLVLCFSLHLLLLSPIQADENEPLLKKISTEILRNGRTSGTAWFHPRACLIPGRAPEVLMTLQSITGSDVFGHVHWATATSPQWKVSEPQKIKGLGRQARANGIQEGVCDVVPEHHPRTGTVLAIGHNVFYRNARLMRPQPARRPVYIVRSKDGKWSAPRPLLWDDPRGRYIYTCNCSQRLTMPSGDVLIPITFGSKNGMPRSVTTLLCTFDGKTLAVKKTGNELKGKVRRGLLEPSLAFLHGRYFMTIRAEDNRGYVTTSKDGLAWEKPKAWSWDDGKPLTMSTTQQRWLPHSDGLFLVYTRKAKKNVNVFRWRAPLYVAKVDLKSLQLIRKSEQIVFPMIGDGINKPKDVARMGNFHTTAVTPLESWVTVGETLPAKGFRGNLLRARITWSKPNRLVPK